jgi:hypothetical protein
MAKRFCWTAFDVTDLLPQDWTTDIKKVAAEAFVGNYPRTPFWLYELYRREFLGLAEQAWGEPIRAASDNRYGVVLNVQQGKTMRFECHVDSNPVTGLLFFTEHPDGGGELVVANDPEAVGVDALEENGSVIRPQKGQLIFFDGKSYPHYARTLWSNGDVRVVAVMNFYTQSCPESARPSGLNRHLFGQD